MVIRKIYYWLNPSLRRVARRIVFLPNDVLDILTGRKQDLVPPKSKIYTGRGNFIAIGDKFLALFVKYCGLMPDAKVLDIGCGIGRIARQLAFFLNDKGEYRGFDVVKDGIIWCQKNYIKFKNFHFQYVPIINDLYNLEANAKASTYRFPYDDQSFDLLIAVSVFTHMQKDDLKNYFSQMHRVLQPGGKIACTFFIVNEVSEDSPASVLKMFPYDCGDYLLHDNKVKDANIAYKESALKEMISDARLQIQHHFPGWWMDEEKKQSRMDYQDILILTTK